MAAQRRLAGASAIAATLLAVAASSFHIYTTWFGFLEPRSQRAVHVGLLLPIVFLLYPAREREAGVRPSFWDWLWAALAILANGYILWNAARIIQRWEGSAPVLPAELIWGTILTLLILEATRRAVSGWL